MKCVSCVSLAQVGRSQYTRQSRGRGVPAETNSISTAFSQVSSWAGVTLSLKNFFGVMPGTIYGWPKNVLHYAGIGPSIFDIAAAVRPHLAIVDGIIGTEGEGPIMGTPRHAGVLVMGTNLPAVDATCGRPTDINPWRIGYLAAAAGRLGAGAVPIHLTYRRRPCGVAAIKRAETGLRPEKRCQIRGQANGGPQGRQSACDRSEPR